MGPERIHATTCGGMEVWWEWSGEKWLLVFDCECGISQTVDMTGSTCVLVDCVCGHAVMTTTSEAPNVA